MGNKSPKMKNKYNKKEEKAKDSNNRSSTSETIRSSLSDVFNIRPSSIGQITTAYNLSDSDLKYLSKQTDLNENAIKEIFNKFCDNNPTGYLNKDEFVRLYCSLRSEPPEKLKNIAEFAFNAFDIDKNGNI